MHLAGGSIRRGWRWKSRQRRSSPQFQWRFRALREPPEGAGPAARILPAAARRAGSTCRVALPLSRHLHRPVIDHPAVQHGHLTGQARGYYAFVSDYDDRRPGLMEIQ